MKYELIIDIRKCVENTTFEKAYVRGDPWKGYEVKNKENGMVIASTSSETDAEFIANARQDILVLLAEVERLSKELAYEKTRNESLESSLQHYRGYA